MFNDILTNPIYGIISFVLTVISFFLAFVFYYKSRTIKLPCYNKKSKNLISYELRQSKYIQVMFNGVAVKTLSTTCIAFWNNGRTTITKDDIALKDPLRIEAKGDSEILAVGILECNRPANNFNVELQEDGKSAIVSFDFIDFKHGVVIQIYHTGTHDRDISVAGTIKGMGGFINGDRFGEVIFGLVQQMLDRFGDIFFGNPLMERINILMRRVESRQNALLDVIVFLPIMIATAPFIIPIFFMTMVIMFVGLLILPFVLWKYSVPKELYSTYKYSIDYGNEY